MCMCDLFAIVNAYMMNILIMIFIVLKTLKLECTEVYPKTGSMLEAVAVPFTLDIVCCVKL